MNVDVVPTDIGLVLTLCSTIATQLRSITHDQTVLLFFHDTTIAIVWQSAVK